VRHAVDGDLVRVTYEYLPSKGSGNNSRYTLKEILLKIDRAIEAEEVVQGSLYLAYWKRYLFMERWGHFINARKARAASPTYYKNLVAEHKEYYEKGRISPGPWSTREWNSRVQHARRKRYHELARAVRAKEGKGRVIGGRQLAYQAVRD